MTAESGPAESADQHYKIGAVSAMTGVPTVTLRMWERRHQVVVPSRTESGNRVYTRAQVARLRLIKQAVDAGHAISTVAGLDQAALKARLDATPPPVHPDQSNAAVRAGPLALAVIGRSLVDEASAGEHVVCMRAPSLDALSAQDSGSLPSVDALIVHLDAVTSDSLRMLQTAVTQLQATTYVVVYHIGSKAHIDLLQAGRGTALAAPVSSRQLLATCRSLLSASPAAAGAPDLLCDEALSEIPARRYTPDQLSHCANVSTTIQCECPEHLALLIERLCAFEAYSADCESRNRDDAAVHMMLHSMSAQARRLLEDALAVVVDHEGIELGPAG